MKFFRIFPEYGQHLMLVFQLDAKHRIRQGLDHRGYDFNGVFFWQTPRFSSTAGIRTFFIDERQDFLVTSSIASYRRPGSTRPASGSNQPEERFLRCISESLPNQMCG